MKKKKHLMILLVLVLVITTCMPLTAMGSDSCDRVIDFLDGGFYITDPEGNIVIEPLYIIDEGVNLPPGYSVNASNNIWYNGNTILFNASVSGASVSKLNLSAQVVGSLSGFTSLGYFTATQGDWYGYLKSQSMLNKYNCYYRLRFTNSSTSTMTIDSITGQEVN